MTKTRLAATATILLGVAAVATAAPAHTAQAADVPPAIAAAVNDNPHRTDAQKARDRYRNPAQTLAFFGIEPGMTVVEPLPGWYTEILGPLLAADGTYIGVNLPPHAYGSAERQARVHRWRDSFVASRADVFGPRAHARFLLTEDGFSAPDSVDAIVAFRSTHGWIYRGIADEVFAEFYRVLKPGGVLGIVQHRDREDSAYNAYDRRGYLKESLVIDLVENAGFKLEAKSEINANPKDTKDYEIGVWALPPRLRVDDEALKEKHRAIGESDRMTLKFVKPAG